MEIIEIYIYIYIMKKKMVQEFGKMATAKQYCEKFFFLYCKAENCVATWYSVLQ